MRVIEKKKFKDFNLGDRIKISVKHKNDLMIFLGSVFDKGSGILILNVFKKVIVKNTNPKEYQIVDFTQTQKRFAEEDILNFMEIKKFRTEIEGIDDFEY